MGHKHGRAGKEGPAETLFLCCTCYNDNKEIQFNSILYDDDDVVVICLFCVCICVVSVWKHISFAFSNPFFKLFQTLVVLYTVCCGIWCLVNIQFEIHFSDSENILVPQY